MSTKIAPDDVAVENAQDENEAVANSEEERGDDEKSECGWVVSRVYVIAPGAIVTFS